MLKTLVCAALASSLALVNAAAFALEDHAPENEPEEREKEEGVRPLAPTPEDLDQFTLKPSDVGRRSGDVPEAEKSPLFTFSGFGMFAAAGADFATTEIGLSRGLEEGNPVAGNRSLRLLHHVVGPAAVFWTSAELEKSGKRKLATTLRVALMAAYGYATLHNLRQVGGIR
jgi:hypothetical protein